MGEGDIGAIIDSYEFQDTDIEDPCLVHVNGNIFAVAYSDATYDGWIKTIEIAADGTITTPFIDSLEFDDVQGLNPTIIKISGNVFAVVYYAAGPAGKIKTVTIADDGMIADTIIDSLTYVASKGARPHIIHISGTVYAIVYTDVWNDGIVTTVTIADDGMIADIIIDSMEFGPTDGKYCKITNVTGNVYAVVHTDINNDCWIRTILIGTSGSIADTAVDSYLFGVGTYFWTNIIQISSNVFAIVYYDVDNDGWITTIEIADNGTITKSIIDTYEFDTDYGTYPYIIHISGNVFAVAYDGGGASGKIRTLEIDPAGQITEPYLSSGAYDAVAGAQPSFLFIAGSNYVVAYRGVLADGFISTVSIETIAAGGPHHEMCMGIGP